MSKPVIVVGAGLSGLACARKLQEQGRDALVLDQADGVGGRLRTDVLDGFRLDRGFQVHFTAYPNARELLDYKALDLRKFEPGALIWDGRELREIHNAKPLQMALSSVLPFPDKMRLLTWNKQVKAMSLDEIWHADDTSAEVLLRRQGFSERFLDFFARPFFGGIFLDRSLSVSARMFTYVWKMLTAGDTAVPAQGIQAIPEQLALGLNLRLRTRVARVLVEGGRATGVELAGGERIEADAVVVATEPPAAAGLTGAKTVPGAKSSACLYFRVPKLPVERPILVLNGTGQGQVNHVAPMTAVAPSLAPAGQHLVSVTILGGLRRHGASLAKEVQIELCEWFPRHRPDVHWKFLRAYEVGYAQMPQPPGFREQTPGPVSSTAGLFLAGETTTHSSIDGALESGLRAASAVLA